MHNHVGQACPSPQQSWLHQGVAPPGRTYLTYRWEVKQGESKWGAHAKNVAMHLCVCLITLIWPLIICNLSNQSLYRVLSLLALLQGSFTETRDEQCVCGMRDEHTCSLYLIHWTLFVHFRILEFLKLLLVWVESVCLFINVCLVIFKTTWDIRL